LSGRRPSNLSSWNMEDIVARSSSELIATLCRIDITVPPRRAGRTTEDCERWSICRLLATLARESFLKYPLKLQHQDKPDFLLNIGDIQVGVEFTEAIPTDLAHASALAEDEAPDGVIDMSLFKWRGQKRTTNELRDILASNKLTGPGWIGDDLKRNWTEAISDNVLNKTKKLSSEGFTRFDNNWLLIYDNLPQQMSDITKAIDCLESWIGDYWNNKKGFQAIFIETGNRIVEFLSSTHKIMKINDLWLGK